MQVVLPATFTFLHTCFAFLKLISNREQCQLLAFTKSSEKFLNVCLYVVPSAVIEQHLQLVGAMVVISFVD